MVKLFMYKHSDDIIRSFFYNSLCKVSDIRDHDTMRSTQLGGDESDYLHIVYNNGFTLQC